MPFCLPFDIGPPAGWVAAHGLPVGATLLDAAGPGSTARHCALMLDPVETVQRDHTQAPFAALEELAASIQGTPEAWRALPGPLPLVSCALSYDLGRTVERLPAIAARESHLPELWAARYSAAYVWDRSAGVGWIVAENQDSAARLAARLAAGGPAPSTPKIGIIAAETDREQYQQAFDAVMERLRDGDTYQVNLSLRFSAPVGPGDPSGIFKTLHDRSPVPFAAFMRPSPTTAILSTSPERFLRWDLAQSHVETRPIKGTRPRGADPQADARLLDALLVSPKDRAEHLMIVDLERNDLGRICVAGSVRAPRLAQPETYATVHHLVSVVEGRLRDDVNLDELLRATFPGGSITGAPKVRAMEIIERLEPCRRGIYCGSVGYLDAGGGGDLNIAIRTAWISGGRIFYQAGGGIVADSQADAEWAEAHVKAKVFLSPAGEE